MVKVNESYKKENKKIREKRKKKRRCETIDTMRYAWWGRLNCNRSVLCDVVRVIILCFEVRCSVEKCSVLWCVVLFCVMLYDVVWCCVCRVCYNMCYFVVCCIVWRGVVLCVVVCVTCWQHWSYRISYATLQSDIEDGRLLRYPRFIC